MIDFYTNDRSYSPVNITFDLEQTAIKTKPTFLTVIYLRIDFSILRSIS